MARFYPNQPNGQHKCEYCDTLYDVAWGYLPKPASDKAFCRCCKKVLAEWDAIDYPIFKRVAKDVDGSIEVKDNAPRLKIDDVE